MRTDTKDPGEKAGHRKARPVGDSPHDAVEEHGHRPVALVIMIGKRLTPSAKRRLTGGR
jgi:hypothetical protein